MGQLQTPEVPREVINQQIGATIHQDRQLSEGAFLTQFGPVTDQYTSHKRDPWQFLAAT